VGVTAADRPARVGPALERGWPLVLSIGLVIAVMRVPSLLEPPQLADEGIYSDIGWALDHGAVLYRTVWDHQPPGVYWLAAGIDAVHTSVLAFHLVATAFVVLSCVLIWLLARRFASRQVAWAATFAFAIVASLPTLQGDLLNTEVIGGSLVLGAMLALTSPPKHLRHFGAGVLLGAAMLFKPAFIADAFALAAIPVWIAIADGRRPGRAERGDVAMVIAGAVIVVVIGAVVLALQGSLGGLLNVLFQQDITYLGSASRSSASSGGTAILAVLTATRTLGVIAVGSVATAVLARRRHSGAAILVWWLAFDVAAAMFSARAFAHYAQQAEPVVCICAAMLVAAALPRWRSVVATGIVATIAAWVVCEALILAPSLEDTVILRQPLPAYWRAAVSPRSVIDYLGGGWERLAGLVSESQYDAGFGPNPLVLSTAVTLIDSHSRPADLVFVWGEVPWVYSLSSRMPAGQYVSLNSSYISDPGAQARLIAELRARPPEVFVATIPLPIQAQQLLAEDGYKQATGADGEQCWVRESGV
jgi:Dolichyl-phosphate-mannose-protein mannosyltransferase